MIHIEDLASVKFTGLELRESQFTFGTSKAIEQLRMFGFPMGTEFFCLHVFVMIFTKSTSFGQETLIQHVRDVSPLNHLLTSFADL